jgi:hypothetical protein
VTDQYYDYGYGCDGNDNDNNGKVRGFCGVEKQTRDQQAGISNLKVIDV